MELVESIMKEYVIMIIRLTLFLEVTVCFSNRFKGVTVVVNLDHRILRSEDFMNEICWIWGVL